MRILLLGFFSCLLSLKAFPLGEMPNRDYPITIGLKQKMVSFHCQRKILQDRNSASVQVDVCTRSESSDKRTFYFQTNLPVEYDCRSKRKDPYKPCWRNNGYRQIISPEVMGFSEPTKGDRELTGGLNMVTCGEKPAKDRSGVPIKLTVCFPFDARTLETISVDPMYAVFKYGDEEISASLVSYEDGIYIVDRELRKVSLADIPSSFNCENTGPRMPSNRCLVCNCFHESRNKTMQESLAIARVMHSRNLSDDFPRNPEASKNICGVIYDIQPGAKTHQQSWVDEEEKRKMKIGFEAGLGEWDRLAFNRCMQVVKDSWPDSKKFFALYYFKNGLETKLNWMKSCRANVKELNIDNSFNEFIQFDGVRLHHRFVKICEEKDHHVMTAPKYLPEGFDLPRKRVSDPNAVE